MPRLAVDPLAIIDVFLMAMNQLAGDRGLFSETYRKTASTTCGIDVNIAQDKHSFFAASSIVRSPRFQILPAAQTKLVTTAEGASPDVAFDFRHCWPMFGWCSSAEADSKEGKKCDCRGAVGLPAWCSSSWSVFTSSP
jgi:dTDP-4-dehydrorhamnose 3,5-epimerase-like enzyme